MSELVKRGWLMTLHVLRHALAAESREGSPPMYYDRVCFGNVLRYGMGFYCIKIGYGSAQCIKLWNRVFSALCDSFRHCETIWRNFSEQILINICTRSSI